MVNLFKIYMFVFVLTSCAPIPVANQSKADLKNNTTLQAPNKKKNRRFEYLKKQAILADHKLKNITEEKSLFRLMSQLQEGNVTTSDLEGTLFYFNDPVGQGSDDFRSVQYFKCIQVFEEEYQESGVPVYQALYTNIQIDIKVTVYWVGTRPLEGQKLNTDFLIYIEAGSYETKNNDTRSRVIFVRPKWAGSNGYVPN